MCVYVCELLLPLEKKGAPAVSELRSQNPDSGLAHTHLFLFLNAFQLSGILESNAKRKITK